MEDNTIITLTAICAITAIEIVAMVYIGSDVVIISTVVGALAGLGGYQLKK